MTVTIDVAVALHMLGIRVFRYSHHGEETWHDGQMVRLVTTTDDDGTPRHVDASRDAQTGTWRGVVGPQPGPAPLLSSSFWNIQTVLQTRLLDRETGKIIAMHADAPSAQTLQLGQRQVATSKYDLAGPVKGSVWYDGNGCWVQGGLHHPGRRVADRGARPLVHRFHANLTYQVGPAERSVSAGAPWP